MAWTDPRTWVTNEVVTSTIMNTHVRDNLLGVLHPVHTESTTITISNTATETSLFTTPPVIAANAMGTNGWVRVHLWGSFVNNDNTRTMIVRVKFGGTTITSATLGGASASSASTLSWRLEADVINLGSASVQRVQHHLIGLAPGDTDDFGAPTLLLSSAGAAGAINTASNQTLDITVQWSAASSSLTWTKLASRVMLMQA